MSPEYIEYIHYLLEIHKLDSEGLTDSPEADMIRDKSDPLWECLSELERQSVRSVSEAIYTSYEGEKVMSNLTVKEFFESLTWESFKLTLEETLKNPRANIPQEINCPAVTTLFRDIAMNVGMTAIQKPGEPLTPENIFNLDQRLALVRILEALVRIAEKGPVSSSGGLKSIPESSIMKGLGNQAHG